jgi:hypothetical protein
LKTTLDPSPRFDHQSEALNLQMHIVGFQPPSPRRDAIAPSQKSALGIDLGRAFGVVHNIGFLAK